MSRALPARRRFTSASWPWRTTRPQRPSRDRGLRRRLPSTPKSRLISMSSRPSNGPSLSGMRTWLVSYGKRWGNTSQSRLRDELRWKNKQGDADWRNRKRIQAAKEKELARKRERGFREYLAGLAKRAKTKRGKASNGRLRTKKKAQLPRSFRATTAAKKRANRLERLLIEARKSAAFYRKRKAAAKRLGKGQKKQSS